MSDQLAAAMADLEEATVLNLVKAKLDAGENPMTILASCREGMVLVGKRFEAGEYWVSDLMMSGEIFKQVSVLLGSLLKTDTADMRGKVVIATVQGDIHNIGKDIVVSLLRAAGYDVLDLGVDVSPQKIVDAVKDTGATVLGLSGLLTVAFDSMKETVAILAAAGLRSKVRVMVGGGSVSEKVQHYTDADAWGADAQSAVSLCNQWIKEVAR
jgi:methylmalonyl-CoA mutase cobalamin-binding domain/chain